MRRATLIERAKRVSAARKLSRQHGEAEAVRVLVKRFAISAVQARRYVRAGRDPGMTLSQAEDKLPVTVRLPRSLVERLRDHARRSGLGIGLVVAQALKRFLSEERPED